MVSPIAVLDASFMFGENVNELNGFKLFMHFHCHLTSTDSLTVVKHIWYKFVQIMFTTR